MLALSEAQRIEVLEKRTFNMTTELTCIVKTFEDFRLVAQIKKEMEKLHCLANEVSWKYKLILTQKAEIRLKIQICQIDR